MLLVAHLLLLEQISPPARPQRASTPEAIAVSVRHVAAPLEFAPAGDEAAPARRPTRSPASSASHLPPIPHEAQARRTPSASEEPSPDPAVLPEQGWQPTATPAAPAAAAGTREPAARVAPPMRLRYEVRGRTRGIDFPTGEGVLNWRPDGRSYEALLELRVPLLPTRTQRSTGQLSARGLEPVRFSERRRTEEAVHFDRDRERIVFSNNRAAAALEAGAQDRLSVLMQLGALLARQQAPVPLGTSLAMQVAGLHEAETWHFEVQARDALQLPGGSLATLRLVRLPRMEFDYRLELWLAPELDYAPVRLRLTWAHGDWLDQQWSGTDRS
nr:DUF3108 domain-containing protein [Ramlibacter aurantiacus]